MSCRFLACLVLLGAVALRADLPVAPQVLDPQTPAEAWNVIRLSTANVSRLLKEQRLDEVPQQIALCSPALRTLARFVSSAEQRQRVDTHTALAFRLVNDIAQAGMTRLQQSCESSFNRLQAELVELRPAFTPAEVDGEIHTCPQHPEMLTPQSGSLCRFCHGRLRVRRIPYTDLHATPEVSQAMLKLSAGKVVTGAGLALEALVQTPEGRPLTGSSLISFHGAPLRLLVVDPALSDFHLLTPEPSTTPGLFTSTFIPKTSGPYRVWAEVVPEQTALPEHPWADLGGEFKVVDQSRHVFMDALSATAGGLQFQLGFSGGNGGAPHARQVSGMRLQITDSTGRPVTRLEPLMNAFAHLTGIHEDGKTVLRLHPAGGDILRDDLRGGPALSFKIYPPEPGFIRFFCQVKVDGRIITAPLGLHIVP